MNERIRLLAEQAGFFPELNWDHTGWHAAGHDDTFEKFAELIVKECVKVVDDTMTENQEMNIGLVMASAAIIAHFGVEE